MAVKIEGQDISADALRVYECVRDGGVAIIHLDIAYLPIDKFGADCLFQIISHRYERGATLITTNRVYKHWASIFNNDAVLTSALLDRLLHHAETVRIEGKSYRSKDQIEI